MVGAGWRALVCCAAAGMIHAMHRLSDLAAGRTPLTTDTRHLLGDHETARPTAINLLLVCLVLAGVVFALLAVALADLLRCAFLWVPRLLRVRASTFLITTHITCLL